MTYDDFCATIHNMLKASGYADPASKITEETDALARLWHEGFSADEAANEVFGTQIEEAA